MSSAVHDAELPRSRAVARLMLAALTLARLASVDDPPFGRRR